MFKFETWSHIGQAGLLIILSQSPSAGVTGVHHVPSFTQYWEPMPGLCILGIPEGFVIVVAVIKTMTKTNGATPPASLATSLLPSLPSPSL